MNSEFSALNRNEAKGVLSRFLNFATENSTLFIDQFVGNPQERFGISTLQQVLENTFQKIDGFAPSSNEVGPKWIEKTVSKAIDDRNRIFLTAAWYFGETFVRSFPEDQFFWTLGDPKTLHKNAPAISGFPNGCQLPPLGCLARAFDNEKDVNNENNRGIACLVEAWISIVPSARDKATE